MLSKKILFLFAFCSSNVFAGMTVEHYKTTSDQEMVDTYLAGVLNGFAFANTELSDQKRKPLYCPPADLSINVDMGRKLLQNGFKRYNKLSLPVLEIEPMLLRELSKSYPCKK